MGRMGKFDFKDFKKLQKQLQSLEQDANQLFESCARELAARLLRLVIKRTPVGDYSREVSVTAKRDSKNHKKGDVYKEKVNPGGKMGGTLRRGWTNGEQASAYAANVPIHHFGDTYVIEIINPVEYAAYVEYGHRTANHRGWVKGHFMMTISEQELQAIAPKILENRIRNYLKGFQK